MFCSGEMEMKETDQLFQYIVRRSTFIIADKLLSKLADSFFVGKVRIEPLRQK